MAPKENYFTYDEGMFTDDEDEALQLLDKDMFTDDESPESPHSAVEHNINSSDNAASFNFSRWNLWTSIWTTLKSNKKSIAAWFIFLFLAIFCFHSLPQSFGNSSLSEQRYLNLEKEISTILKQQRDVQPAVKHLLFRSLSRAAKRFSGFNETSLQTQPIFVLLAVTNELQIKNLTTEFSQAVQKHTDTFVTQVSPKSSKTKLEFEWHVFSQLRKARNRNKLLILHNINELSRRSPLALQGLIDNEILPLKNLVIVATLTIDETPKHVYDVSDCAQLVSSRLMSSWTSKDLRSNQMSPIIAYLKDASICVNLC